MTTAKRPDDAIRPTIRRPGAVVLAAIAVFVGLNLLVPATWGELFPFSCAPMFRDSPRCYCEYRVIADDVELDAKTARCHRVYDGNPVGLGVGICPPETLDSFGTARTRDEIAAHARRLFDEHADWNRLEVWQETIGPKPDGSVGTVKTERFEFDRGSLAEDSP